MIHSPVRKESLPDPVRFTVTQDNDGTLHFTTRSGHTHTTTPDQGWALTYPTAQEQADTPAGNGQGEPPCDDTPPPF
jgi:hypothetical protein